MSAVARQGPHLTSKKSDGRTKGLKRAFLTLRAIFSAKNDRKLKNGTFLESPVCEFSDNGFGSEKKLFSRPLDLETARPPIWGGFETPVFVTFFHSDLFWTRSAFLMYIPC